MKINHNPKKQLIPGFMAKLLSFGLALIFGWSHALASDGSYPALRDSIDQQFQALFQIGTGVHKISSKLFI